MKALFLTSNYPRWVDDSTTPFVHDLAADLVRRDWEVTVLAPHAKGAAKRETLDGVQVRRFRYLVPERAQTVCYGGGALLNVASSRRTRAKVPALVAAEWTATTRALSDGFDVVHAHWALPQGFVSAISPHQRVPRIVTVHGSDVLVVRGRLIDRFSAFALRRADCVTAGSKATASAAREIAGSDTRVESVPFGVDLTRSARPELVDQIRARHRRHGGPFLVFVGRVSEDKGVLELVKAVAILSAELHDVSVALVGTGTAITRAKQLAAEYRVADRVALPGWARAEEVPSWFAAADVVVAPSLSEGQGLSIIEALAAGRPVVAARTGGIPETIVDNETGLLVEPGDSHGLARAILRLTEEPELARRVAANGAVSVRKRFDRSVTATRFDSIYREAIDAHSIKVPRS